MSSGTTQLAESSITLRGAALATAIVVLSLANFMAVLDINVVNVALPYIAGGLGVSPDEATWAITSYAVAEAIVVLLTGWLASQFGTVRIFIVGVIGFGVASVMCGLATSFPMLIVFRLMQGLMGAPLIPASQTLVMRVAPPERQNMAMGIWTMTTISGPIVGPWLGGGFADTIGWRWVFFLNIPIVIACAVLAWRAMRGRETEVVSKKVDFVGLGLLIIWVGALQILLDNGQKKDWFESNFITASAIIAVIGFLAFVAWEITEEHPIVNLRIFRNRTFAVSAFVMLLTFGSFSGAIVIIPLWLQTNMGYTATYAGKIIALTGVLGICVAPIVATLMSRVDPRGIICVGLLIVSGACLYRIGFNQEITYGQLVASQMVFGIGLVMYVLPIMSLSVASVSSDETAAAAGLTNFIRTIATAIAVALATTYWVDDAIQSRAQLVGVLQKPGAVLSTFQRAGLTSQQALQSLDGITQSQSVMLATNHFFFAISILLFITSLLVWLMPKPKHALTPMAPIH